MLSWRVIVIFIFSNQMQFFLLDSIYFSTQLQKKKREERRDEDFQLLPYEKLCKRRKEKINKLFICCRKMAEILGENIERKWEDETKTDIFHNWKKKKRIFFIIISMNISLVLGCVCVWKCEFLFTTCSCKSQQNFCFCFLSRKLFI